MSAAVIIENLTRRFDTTTAIDGLTASIIPGKITGLVGPDGAGKTTLIRLIAGLLIPTEGNISVYGLDTVKQSEAIHDILGYMPQRFGLYEDLSVIENLRLYASLKNVNPQEQTDVFARMLQFTGLAPFTERLAGKLSGGMKQKLGLACALLAKPKLLLLDEPSVGVDPVSRRELWNMVQEMAGEGMAVLWSTAYLDEAEKCHEVLLLNEGKLLFQGAPADLTKRVENRTWLITCNPVERRERLMQLLKEGNLIDGVIQGSKIRVVIKEGTDTSNPGEEEALTTPRFEDAFIDILGGMQQRESAIAKHIAYKENKGLLPIEARGLTKRFGDFIAAHNINIAVQPGEIFGLLGPNGAGKSTTFKMLCGLLQATQGQARIMGLDLKDSSAEARLKIGYMAQKFSLYSDLNVLQNLRFFSGVYGLKGAVQQQRIEEMIEIFDLSHYLTTTAGLLPLGFKQRLSLACAVMHEPDVLFLDEPTSGVDPLTRREFWMHINGMAEKNVTIMVTTHFMDEAEYCDRIALIYRGEDIATGAPDDLKEKVKNEFLPDPSLEDAFIELIRRADELREENAA